jgi:hypothetical protein
MTLQYDQNYINQDGTAITLVPEDPAQPETFVLHGAGGRLYTVDMTGVTAAITILLPRVSEAGLNAEITIVGKADQAGGGSLTVDVQTSPPALPPQDILGWSGGASYPITVDNATVTFSNDAKTTWFVTAITQ